MSVPLTEQTPDQILPPGLLLAPDGDDDAVLSRLQRRLAAAAADTGILDVAYTVVNTPVGELLLAATPAGLVRVAFACEDHDTVLATLAALISPRILNAPDRLCDAADQIGEYFAGTRRRFDLPLDLRLTAGFRRAVVEHLPDIGYGSTASYSALAALTGNPGAVRAVGTACALNPLPVVVPCHRVVRSDGTTGNYRGGPDAKRLLLDLEAAA
jgi:methylated-DNA-[protein]-cysteine S-methyltransferase